MNANSVNNTNWAGSKATKEVNKDCSLLREFNLESQNTKLLQALSTLIDEHEECTDFEGWEAYICSPEAIHEASEILDSILN